MDDFSSPTLQKTSTIAAKALAARNQGEKDSLYLEDLNHEQKQAVLATEGPVLVLAGAGTGKTRVLISRIAHILQQKLAFPSQILSVTFTNKAAREMKTRVSRLLGGDVEGMPWLGTFHSIGVKMLRRHAQLVGLESNFSILDSDDAIRLLKQIIQAEGLDEKRWPARHLAALIDQWKNRGLRPERAPLNESYSFAQGRGQELYAAYQQRLKTINACDFGDLLLHPIHLFQHNPDILAEYHRKFRYIMVDEYQDTNTAQYLWLRLLAQNKTNGLVNLCCVGDDDQAIYSWRGANIENILRFEKDFPNTTVIRLERNYRSTNHILASAAHLIAHNEGRLGKTVFAHRSAPDDPKIHVHAAWDSTDEARAIGEEIEAAQIAGKDLNSMAILVRASFQMREFEDRFLTMGLNYRVIGGPRFYERLEIRDALAYLRVIRQCDDDLAFERIINTPKRSLGDVTVRLLYEQARIQGTSLFKAAWQSVENGSLRTKPRAILRGLLEQFAHWQEQIPHIPHTELAQMVLDESGYTTMWQNDPAPEAAGRLENLKELIRSMEAFESLDSFLEHISLVMDIEQQEDTEAVTIMTLHAAKGLEFETIFLPGWEEGLFPHQRALDDEGRAGLEEERRLAYVGLTRARKYLHIWFTSNRFIYGFWQCTNPSRFLDELPPDHIEIPTPSHQRDSSYRRTSVQHKGADREPYNATRFSGKTIDIQTQKVTFTLGERVFHNKFGNGSVILIDGDKLTIHFDKAGEKRVMFDFVKKAAS